MANKKKNDRSGSNSSAKFTFWVIGLVVVCIAAFIFLGNHTKKQDTTKTNNIDYSNQPYLGKKTAPVSIIEFGDYKCPNCKNFAINVVPIIEKELVDTGKAKFYFMNDSFINTDSIRSAKFAESVFKELGNETFWKFHELLYKKQPTESKAEQMDVYTESFLKDTLSDIVSEAEVNKVVNAFKNDETREAWEKDMSAASRLSIT